MDEDLWTLEHDIKSSQIVRKFESKWYPALDRLKKYVLNTTPYFRFLNVFTQVIENVFRSIPDGNMRVHYENQELLGNGVGREAVHIAQKPSKGAKTASIFRPLCQAFGPYFMFGVVLKLFQDVLTFVSPQILRYVSKRSALEICRKCEGETRMCRD